MLYNFIKNLNVLLALVPLASAYLLFFMLTFQNRITEFWEVCKIYFAIKITIHMTILWDTQLTLPVRTDYVNLPLLSLNLFLLCIYSCGCFFCNRIAQSFQRHTQPSQKPLTLLYYYTNKQCLCNSRAVFLLLTKNKRHTLSVEAFCTFKILTPFGR